MTDTQCSTHLDLRVKGAECKVYQPHKGSILPCFSHAQIGIIKQQVQGPSTTRLIEEWGNRNDTEVRIDYMVHAGMPECG